MIESVPFARAFVCKKVAVRKKLAARTNTLIAALGVMLAMFLGAAPARAQLQSSGTMNDSAKPAAPPHSSGVVGGGGVRVFMTNSGSWKQTGGWGLAGQSRTGTAAPADPDGKKSFEKHCSQYPITSNRDAATYVILLDQLNTKQLKKGRDKITVYDRAGIVVYSNSTRLLDDSIRDACKAIGGNHSKHK
jgi:hypothetical protein